MSNISSRIDLLRKREGMLSLNPTHEDIIHQIVPLLEELEQLPHGPERVNFNTTVNRGLLITWKKGSRSYNLEVTNDLELLLQTFEDDTFSFNDAEELGPYSVDIVRHCMIQ